MNSSQNVNRKALLSLLPLSKSFFKLSRKVLWLGLILFSSLWPKAVLASTLSTLAASLSPGQFAEITGMIGFSGGAIMTPTPGCTVFQDVITQFTNKAVWNPVTNKFQFVGAPHGGVSCGINKMVIYDDATNTWSVGPQPTSSQEPQHSYDHNTINPANGTMYWRQYGSTNFYTLPNGAGSWSKIAAPSTSIQCCGALEFFPDQNRLIFIDGDNGGWSYNPATNSWSQLWFGFNGGGTPQLTMGHYTNFVAYSNLGFLVFGGGGGDNHVYKMNAAGTITAIASPPFGNIAIGTDEACCSVAADPVTGHIVVIDGSRNVWNLNPSSGSWSNTGTVAPTYFSPAGQDLISAPISDYGVIMYVKCDRTSSCRAYLYKHGAGTPGTSDTTAPTNPSGLIATAISSSQINLSWTASTDAIGVTSYLIERSPSGCAAFAQINTSATNSFSDTGRTASTTYCYRIRATDAAGNLSGYTASVSGTTGTTQAPDTTAPTTPSRLDRHGHQRGSG